MKLSELHPNINNFILFRLFFNCRFYYPVLSILFIDFGLSIEQYSLLNVAWAVSIICFEVPSGALADIVGRKKLLVFSSVIMLFEMLVFCLAPIGDHIDILFPLFLLNRVLSGLAEAAASGADEALAYDSLTLSRHADEWPSILEKLMKLSSICMGLSMLFGAIVYDYAFLNKLLGLHLTQEDTIKFPLYLTFLLAVGAFIVTLRMKEINFQTEVKKQNPVVNAWKEVFSVGKYILNNRYVLVIILAGLLFDSTIRMFVTLASNYFRAIQIPEALFGLLTMAMVMTGHLSASFAKKLFSTKSPLQNLLLIFFLTLTGLIGAIFTIKYFSFIFVLVIGISMNLVGFFMSAYLNREIDSKRRATVLSFKGLAFNIGYAFLGWGFAQLVFVLKKGAHSNVEDIEQWGYVKSLPYFSYTLIIGFIILLLFLAASKKQLMVPRHFWDSTQ